MSENEPGNLMAKDVLGKIAIGLLIVIGVMLMAFRQHAGRRV